MHRTIIAMSILFPVMQLTWYWETAHKHTGSVSGLMCMLLYVFSTIWKALCRVLLSSWLYFLVFGHQ